MIRLLDTKGRSIFGLISIFGPAFKRLSVSTRPVLVKRMPLVWVTPRVERKDFTRAVLNPAYTESGQIARGLRA